MFTSRHISVGEDGTTLEYRRETLTGFSCRISPGRIKRDLNTSSFCIENDSLCPFCPDIIQTATPVFSGGDRICRGESITFPNKFPFAAWHTVTVVTRSHMVERFSARQIADALNAQVESMRNHEGYPSIIWNYLPSAGASLVHPHIQGLVDPVPTYMVAQYLTCGEFYLKNQGRVYWNDLRMSEKESPRFFCGDEIQWGASPVPHGEREIRALLPVSTIDEFPSFIDTFAREMELMLDFYRSIGSQAFNMGLFFQSTQKERGFRAFCSIIARISPNPVSASDSSAMERLHLEPVILTLPEDLASRFHAYML